MPDTQLMQAIKSGDTQQAIKLIESNPEDVNIKDEEGSTPLHLAVKANSEILVHHLLEAGADPNIQDGNSNTPLMLAAKRKLANIILVLAKKGDSLEIPDRKGMTPLMKVIWKGYHEGIRILLEAGASLMAEDDSGLTLLDLVHSLKDPEIISMIEHRGQDNDFVRIIVEFSDGMVRTAYVPKSNFSGCDFSKFSSMRIIAPPDMFKSLSLDNKV